MKDIKKVLSTAKAAKLAHKGKDMGKKGKGFKKGVEKLEKEGKSAKSAKKIMGAQFWKMRKKGQL